MLKNTHRSIYAVKIYTKHYLYVSIMRIFMRTSKSERAPVPKKGTQTSPPQKSCKYRERCGMCSIKRKIIFHICPIFIFQVTVKIHRKFTMSSTKMTISHKKKSLKFENWFFIRFSTFRIKKKTEEIIAKYAVDANKWG